MMKNNYGFTPKQRNVADLIMEGYSNKEIAYCLGLSLGTIKTHVWRISKMVGTNTRIRTVLTLLRNAGRLQ